MQMRHYLILLFLGLLLFSCQDKGRIVTPKPGPARLSIPQQTWNVGSIRHDRGVMQFDVLMVNEGSEDLTITEVENLCHCTHAEYADRPIVPGHGARLTIYLNTGSLGYGQFSRTVIVHSNGGDVPIDINGNRID